MMVMVLVVVTTIMAEGRQQGVESRKERADGRQQMADKYTTIHLHVGRPMFAAPIYQNRRPCVQV
jgi:hypothetical protein